MTTRCHSATARTSPRWADRALQLPAQERCPVCAERRDPRSLLSKQTRGYRWPAVTDQDGGVDWTDRLDAHLGRRAAALVAFAFLLGLLPVFGAVAAPALVGVQLVAYRRAFRRATQG